MLTTDENAIAISAAKDYADNVPGSRWQDLTPLTTMLNAFIAGYRLGHSHAQCPPTNDANASYLPRLDDKPATFQLIGDRATIRVTNPQWRPANRRPHRRQPRRHRHRPQQH